MFRPNFNAAMSLLKGAFQPTPESKTPAPPAAPELACSHQEPQPDEQMDSPAGDRLERVIVLVDSQNIYYSTRLIFDKRFSYARLLSAVSANRHIVKAVVYVTEREKGAGIFQERLRRTGYEVKEKISNRKTESARGQWDITITLDAIAHAKDVDRVILVSGNGDFEPLVSSLLRDFGVKTEVHAVAPLTSRDLIDAANPFVPIGDSLLY
jgi:uncharacterized LabA/DUF88 family protein